MMDDQLKTLFDYTKFHIGVYITLGSGIAGVLAYEASHTDFSLGCYARWGFRLSLLLLALAGLGGGIIAGNLIDFTTLADFRKAFIYWGKTSVFWERLEHWSIWLAALAAGISGAFLIDNRT